ncbi:MAG TPA: hypothetical protein VH724_10125 [Candidatus Angelobacter sp.]|nr:hypothetical protein [Candidatus Angelobacter sp.]
MSRPVFVILFLASVLQASQAQLFSRGAPASVTSPTADGRQHGVPASVVSPTPLPFGVNPPLRHGVRIRGPLRRFGNQHPRRQVFVPVPVFYSLYGDGSYPSVADPYVPESQPDTAQANEVATDRNQTTADRNQAANRNDDELRAAYLQGARDALTQQDDNRYGEHYMDSRERSRQQPAAQARQPERKAKPDDEIPAALVEDKAPGTVFIFKDGHQMETKNYAIMSGTLFDFSGKTLRKINVEELDSAATVKANDDRGVVVKLN